MVDVQGDMYGGPLKGDAPLDNVDSYTAQEIRQWVLNSDPDAIAAAGNAYLDFKKAFQGEGAGELLGFLKKIGSDLDQAWGGAKSGAPACQQQLSMLWQSAKELIDSADALGQALKSHGEDDSDHSLKGLKKYFHIKDSGIGELWGLVHDPSPFDNEVWEKTRISPDEGFTYKGTDGDPPAPGSQADIRNRQIVDETARNKLKAHNGLPTKGTDGPLTAPTGTVNSTYTSMPGYLSLELPPGTLPAQQKPIDNPTQPGPTNPPDPKRHSRPTGPTSTPYYGNQYSGGHTGTPSVPSLTNSSSGGSHLSGINTPSSGSTNLSNLPGANLPGGTPGGSSPLPGGGTPGGTIPGGPTPGGTIPPYVPMPSTGIPSTGARTGSGALRLGGEELPGLGGLRESPFGSGSGAASRGLLGGENGATIGSGGKLPASGVTAEAAEAARAVQAGEAQAMGASAARANGMMPMMPMGGMGGPGGQNERNRETWMHEEEGVWTGDQDTDSPIGGDGVIRSA